MRILALHGYQGSADALRRQMRPLGLDAEIVALDAPALADGDFGWWHARDGRYEGWARSRDAIIEACATPFDGVFGFSQGAALAALMVAEVAFRFAIMVGGFPSRDPAHAALFARAERYAIPSLHIVGREDTIVPPDASRALAARFRDPTILEHDGGHVIAATDEVRARTKTFLHAF
jgi:pimeloyl-ACP methyl ester carboxylesterase